MPTLRHLPIIHTKIQSELDLKEFPALAHAQRMNHFSRDTLRGLCQYGMHCIPDLDKRKAVLEFLDGLAKRSNNLGQVVKVGKSTLNLARILDRSINSDGPENFNGARPALLANIFLAEMKNQGLIKDFYYSDGPLRAELLDPRQIQKSSAEFLDCCGIDILIENNFGKFIPIQLKASAEAKREVRMLFTNDEMNHLLTQDPDIWNIKVEPKKVNPNEVIESGDLAKMQPVFDGKLTQVIREIPCFTFNFRSGDLQTLFQRFHDFISSQQDSTNALDFSAPIVELSKMKILDELVKKGFLTFRTNQNHSEPVKLTGGESFAGRNLDFVAPNLTSTGNLNLLKNISDYLRTQFRRAQLAPEAENNVDGVMSVLSEKYQKLNPEMQKIIKVSWLRELLNENRLGPSALNKLEKTISSLANSEDWSLELFQKYKKQLTIAYLKDNADWAKDYSDSQFEAFFDREDSNGAKLLDPLRQSIATMLLTINNFES